jgi:hypothetical protein
MNKSIGVFFIFFFILTTGRLFAQNGGSVTIHESAAIKNLVAKHIQVNQYHPWINGYRVQLYSVSGVNSRDKANTFMAQFLLKNPNARIYIVYHAPYYKVRVGDFRSKIDALSYLQTIKKDYPSGFVVVDKIKFKEEKEEEESKRE